MFKKQVNESDSEDESIKDDCDKLDNMEDIENKEKEKNTESEIVYSKPKGIGLQEFLKQKEEKNSNCISRNSARK